MGQTAKILIVDDEAGFCELVHYLLTKEGYGVDAATGGEEGLKLLQQNTYDIVYADLKMPGMDRSALAPP